MQPDFVSGDITKDIGTTLDPDILTNNITVDRGTFTDLDTAGCVNTTKEGYIIYQANSSRFNVSVKTTVGTNVHWGGNGEVTEIQRGARRKNERFRVCF